MVLLSRRCAYPIAPVHATMRLMCPCQRNPVLYQPPLMLTHEEWVNRGRYESLFARRRPPTRRAIPTARWALRVGLSGGWYYTPALGRAAMRSYQAVRLVFAGSRGCRTVAANCRKANSRISASVSRSPQING